MAASGSLLGVSCVLKDRPRSSFGTGFRLDLAAPFPLSAVIRPESSTRGTSSTGSFADSATSSVTGISSVEAL